MDRNPDDFGRAGYRQHPYYPPHLRYPDSILSGAPYSAGSYPYTYPKEKHCCCSTLITTVNLLERKITSMQSTVERIAIHNNIPIGPQEDGKPQQTSEGGGMSLCASVHDSGEQDTTTIPIPSTSRERRQLIKRMEQELEQRRVENRRHEDRIAGLRRELEELRTRNAK